MGQLNHLLWCMVEFLMHKSGDLLRFVHCGRIVYLALVDPALVGQHLVNHFGLFFHWLVNQIFGLLAYRKLAQGVRGHKSVFVGYRVTLILAHTNVPDLVIHRGQTLGQVTHLYALHHIMVNVFQVFRHLVDGHL